MSLPRRPSPATIAVVLCAVLLAGCSGGKTDSASPPTKGPGFTPPPSVSPSPLPPCKLPKPITFPSWVPEDLPLFKGTYASQRLPQTAGYSRGLFIMPANTTQFAKFVLKKWPEAGYQLGRGDAEPGEVEDQFLKPPAFGAFKAQDMLCDEPHAIMLLIYVPDRSKLPSINTQPTSPLPQGSPTGSASPLVPSPSPS